MNTKIIPFNGIRTKINQFAATQANKTNNAVKKKFDEYGALLDKSISNGKNFPLDAKISHFENIG